MCQRTIRRSTTLLAIVGVVVVVSGCLGNDYASSPVGVGDMDPGAWVVVEPGDEFVVGLLGHPAHPDAAWVITVMDTTVVHHVATRHEPRGTAAPDAAALALMPDPVEELWSTLPDPGRLPDYQAEGEPDIWYWPLTSFEFTGADYGESDLALELRVDDTLIHSFRLDVSVVEDACEYFVSQESLTKVPHRCG